MLLHYFKCYTDKEGGFVVTRNDVAGLLNVSVVTAKKRVERLVDLGYVHASKQPLARGAGYKWVHWITDRGCNIWSLHKGECYDLFMAYKSDRLIAALEEAKRISKKHGKVIKRSQKQLSLFGDE